MIDNDLKLKFGKALKKDWYLYRGYIKDQKQEFDNPYIKHDHLKIICHNWLKKNQSVKTKHHTANSGILLTVIEYIAYNEKFDLETIMKLCIEVEGDKNE